MGTRVQAEPLLWGVGLAPVIPLETEPDREEAGAGRGAAGGGLFLELPSARWLRPGKALTLCAGSRGDTAGEESRPPSQSSGRETTKGTIFTRGQGPAKSLQGGEKVQRGHWSGLSQPPAARPIGAGLQPTEGHTLSRFVLLTFRCWFSAQQSVTPTV